MINLLLLDLFNIKTGQSSESDLVQIIMAEMGVIIPQMREIHMVCNLVLHHGV